MNFEMLDIIIERVLDNSEKNTITQKQLNKLNYTSKDTLKGYKAEIVKFEYGQDIDDKMNSCYSLKIKNTEQTIYIYKTTRANYNDLNFCDVTHEYLDNLVFNEDWSVIDNDYDDLWFDIDKFFLKLEWNDEVLLIQNENYLYKLFDRVLDLTGKYNRDANSYWEDAVYLRFLGAFNSQTVLKTNFNKTLKFELNSDRELSCDFGKNIEDILYKKYRKYDNIYFSNLAFLYSKNDIKNYYINDVWSYSVGSHLIPSRYNSWDNFREGSVYHTEGFIKKRSRPTAIVIFNKNEWRNQDKLYIVEQFAKENNLPLIYFEVNKTVYEKIYEYKNIDAYTDTSIEEVKEYYYNWTNYIEVKQDYEYGYFDENDVINRFDLSEYGY